MERGVKFFRRLTMLTQLGLSIVAPPLLLIYLAHLAQTRWGWGAWTMLAAILIGLLSSGAGVYRLAKTLLQREKKDETTSFNEHS